MAQLEYTLQPLQVAERVRDVLRTWASGLKDTIQDEGSLEGTEVTSITLPDVGSVDQVLIQPEDDDYLPQRYPSIWVMVPRIIPGNKTLTQDRSVVEVKVRVWLAAPGRASTPRDPSQREALTRASLAYVSLVMAIVENYVPGGAGVYAAHCINAQQARPLQEPRGIYFQCWDIDCQIHGKRRHNRGLA